MSEVLPFPDLKALTAEEKSALIRRLWSALAASEGGERTLEALASEFERVRPAASSANLREALRDKATMGRARAPQAVRARLGRGLGLWRAAPVKIAVTFVAAALLLDAAVGWYQEREVRAREAARIALENVAFNRLYVELTRASYDEAAGTYRAHVSMQRIGSDGEMFVMLMPARVYVQSALEWQEVPSQPVEGGAWGVTKLTDGHEFEIAFDADAVADWAELMPGYMHVRVDSDMLISETSEPGDAIAERRNRFYIYLKPQNADDEDIKARAGMKGDPPDFLPMPPH